MKLVEKFVKIGLFVALLTPLFHTAVPYSFSFQKAMFFQMVVEITLAGWLILYWQEKEKYEPELNLIGKAMLLFVGITALSAFLGSDFYRSLFSTAERGDGVIFLLHGAAFLVMLSSVFDDLKEWLNYLRGAVFVGVMVGVYGVLQKYASGLGFLPAQSGRLIATLGNADFLGTYSLFLIFLPWVPWLLERKSEITHHFWKPLYLVGSGLGVFLLLFSGTRGALAGLIAGVIALLGFWLISGRGWLQKGFVVLLLLAVVGSGFLLYLYQDAPALEKIPVFGRLFEKKGLRMGTSAKTRWLSIGMGLQSLKDAPLLGQGWSNWNVVFDKYFNPDYLKHTDDWFDKAHNMPLEVLVTTGIIGFLSYLSVFLLLLWTLWKKRSQALSVVLVGLIAAYFVQNATLFDTPSTWLMLLLVVAFVDRFSFDPDRFKCKGLQFDWQRVLSGLLLIILPFTFYFLSYKPLLASRQLKKATQSPGIAYSAYKDLLEKDTSLNYRAVIKLGETITGNYSEDAGWVKPTLELETKYLKKQVKKHPNDMKLKLLLARMYNYRGVEQEQYFDKADRVLEEAQELAPRRPEVWMEWGFVKHKRGQYGKAVDYYRKGLKYNFSEPKARWKMAVAYHKNGEEKKALEQFEKAKKKGLNWRTTDRLLTLVNIQTALDNYQKANDYYELVLEKEPDNVQYRISYSISFAKVGEYEQAIEQMEKVIEMKPGVKEQAQPYLEKWRKKL